MSSKNVSVNSHRRHTLALSYVEGSMWALMVGSAESFALYFAVRRGLSPTELALVSTVPLLAGAFMNWLVPQFVSNKHLKIGILLCCVIQILGLGLLVHAVQSAQYYRWILAGLSLYWMGGMGATPLWIDWIAGWLPQGRFGRYYSRRSGFLGLITLLTYLGTALFLHIKTSLEMYLYVFGFAFVARGLSTLLLSFQTSPKITDAGSIPAAHLSRRWPMWAIVLFIVFAALFKMVANFSSSFFLPYMMQQLHLSVFEIAVVNGMSFLGLALFMASFGEAVKSFQPITGLQMAMLFASLNCFMWTYVQDIVSISFLQFFAGLTWTGFDLACILVIQSNFRHGARKVLGLQMALASAATIAGSLVGSRFLENGMAYLDLFRISAYARFIVAFSFIGIFFIRPELRIPLRTYGSFLKRAFTLQFTSFDVTRALPALLKRKDD